ncbi:hypothetical protein MKX03_028226 [Papaver bracteatum]|nr:hypothetical protein MKX03_028226 [Papaver bracteatum]
MTKISQHHSFVIKLWPPSQSTRSEAVQRMITNLFAPSSIFFSERYGRLGRDQATKIAAMIESSAFVSANEHYRAMFSCDGSSAVEIYAEETSKLMLDVLKSFSSTPISVKEDHVPQGVPVLASLKEQLTEFDLSGFIAGRSEEFMRVMRIFIAALESCTLRSLNLSYNALGEEGVRDFDALLKSQGNLEDLYLINADITSQAAKAVSELIRSIKKLKILHFHNNMTGDEGDVHISKVKGGISLAEAIQKCSNLKKIDLSDNIVALSKTLSSHAGLTEIYLSGLNLGDEGAIALVNVLKDFTPSLEVLDLAGNVITPAAASALAACIAAKESLAKLKLSKNKLKDEGTILIARALQNGHLQLKEVDLSTNAMTDVGAQALAVAVDNKPECIDEVKAFFEKSLDLLGPLDENE